MRETINSLGWAQSLAPQQVSGAVNGTGVDLQGYDSAALIIDAGALGGSASPTVTFQWQESADNVTYTAIGTSDLLGGQPAAIAAGGVIVKRAYIGSLRYVRCAVTAVAGTAPTLFVSGQVVKGHASQRPVP